MKLIQLFFNKINNSTKRHFYVFFIYILNQNDNYKIIEKLKKLKSLESKKNSDIINFREE